MTCSSTVIHALTPPIAVNTNNPFALPHSVSLANSDIHVLTNQEQYILECSRADEARIYSESTTLN